MSYIFHAMLPYDRLVSIDPTTKQIVVASEGNVNIGSRMIASSSSESTDLEMKSYDQISFEYNFQFTSRLVFEQESDLRNMLVSWGLDEDVFPSAIDLGFASQLKNGAISDKISVRYISNSMGAGLFATEMIPANSFIGEYCGVLRPGSSTRGNPSAYSLNYPSGDSHEVDSQDIGSMMRFCNHSDSPNCTFTSVWLDSVHVCVVVGEECIAAGTQLSVNYGESYWKGQGYKPESISPSIQNV